MRTSALNAAKSCRFFEIYVVSAQTRGEELSQCEHFADREKGWVNFLRFCADILYGRPLISLFFNWLSHSKFLNFSFLANQVILNFVKLGRWQNYLSSKIPWR